MALNKKQLAAIQLLIYSDLPDCRICEEVDINPATLCRWKHLDEFQEEIELENRRKFKRLQKEALKAMEKLIAEGHFQACKYILDGNDYAATEKHDVQMDAKIEVDYGDS